MQQLDILTKVSISLNSSQSFLLDKARFCHIVPEPITQLYVMFVILCHAKGKRKIKDEAEVNNVHVSSKEQNRNIRIRNK